MISLTEDEIKIISDLLNAWDRFVSLPVEHPEDVAEFRQSIHRAQLLVLARPERRAINEAAEATG